MQTKIESLENKLSELQEKISKDAFATWCGSYSTKALKVQLEIDEEELKDNWANFGYNDKEQELRAQGQAQYIKGLKDMLKDIGGFDNA